jgi:hypothetical protein
LQRCPSRQKNCRCRTATFEKKSYRAAAATAYKKILPRRYRHRGSAAMDISEVLIASIQSVIHHLLTEKILFIVPFL